MDPGSLSDDLGPSRRSWGAGEAPSLQGGTLVGMVQAGQIGEALVGRQIVALYNEEHRLAPRKMPQGMRGVRPGRIQTHCNLHKYPEVYALASFLDRDELWVKVGEPWGVQKQWQTLRVSLFLLQSQYLY